MSVGTSKSIKFTIKIHTGYAVWAVLQLTMICLNNKCRIPN